MRAIAALIALMLLVAPAQAGPGADLAVMAEPLRAEARARAEALFSRPGAAAEPLSADDPFIADVEAFAAHAAYLARLADAGGPPTDLGCIFRGMAQDAETRLSGLPAEASAADQARVYLAMARLFEHAGVIGPMLDDEQNENGGASAPPPSCPVIQDAG